MMGRSSAMAEKIRSVGTDTENKTVSAVKESVDKARSAVAEGVGTAKERIQQASGEFSEQAGRAGTYARERVETARENLLHGYDRARKDMDQLGSDVSVFVRENPGRSVLIAAGLGFLIGYALRGDRR